MQWSTSDTIAVLSALAAVFSAVYARRTYTATEDLKKHDFALQLQTGIETLRAASLALPGHLNWANRSHKGVLYDLGHGSGGERSSVWKAWDKRHNEIEREIDSIKTQVPSIDVKGLTLTDLREQIVFVHALQVRASDLKAELDDMLLRDDRQRERLREEARAAAQRRVEVRQSLTGPYKF